MKYVDNEKGLTLVELLVALAIAALVLTVVMSLLIFNYRVFSKSNALSQVQFDVRMASQLITEEVRNVRSVNTNNNPAQDSSLGLSDLQARYALVTSVAFELRQAGRHIFLWYRVDGQDTNGSNGYFLEAEVFLHNITGSVVTTQVTTIHYSK